LLKVQLMKLVSGSTQKVAFPFATLAPIAKLSVLETFRNVREYTPGFLWVPPLMSWLTGVWMVRGGGWGRYGMLTKTIPIARATMIALMTSFRRFGNLRAMVSNSSLTGSSVFGV